MSISEYQSRTGKEKVIANEEKGRRGPKKDSRCSLKDCLLCAGSHHGFSKKRKKKNSECTTFPHLGLTWFYKESPLSP